MARLSVKIDQHQLVTAVNAVENRQKFANISQMLAAAVALYNESQTVKITESQARSALVNWKTPVKTASKKGKSSTTVDEQLLVASINKVEENGSIPGGIVAMTKLAAAEYNKTAAKPITHSIVGLRINALKIPIKTVSGKGMIVDKDELIKCINTVEKDGPVPGGFVALYKLVAAEYNKTAKHPITFSVVGLRIAEFEIQVKTVAGKRGGGGGGLANLTTEQRQKIAGNRKARSVKLKKHPQYAVAMKALREATPERFLPLVDAVGRGSKTAEIKLFCLGCVGYSTADVRSCTGIDCPHYLGRPYQGAVEPEENGQAAEMPADVEAVGVE